MGATDGQAHQDPDPGDLPAPPEGLCRRSLRLLPRLRLAPPGKQETETFRTYAEAREAKGSRESGDRRPVARVRFREYFEEWFESYAGRTSRGFSETSRDEYRRVMAAHVLKKWGTWKLADVEPAEVQDSLGGPRRGGKSTTEIKKVRSTVSVMFVIALEGGLLRSNPAQGVRIPAAEDEGSEFNAGKALNREELGLMLSAIPEEWTLFYELLTHAGLRISEAAGLTRSTSTWREC